MNRSEEVFTNKAFVKHDSILIVITLPWHVSNLNVTSKSKFSALSRITFCKNISLLYTLSLMTDRTKVNSCTLVSLTEFRKLIFCYRIVEAYKRFLFSPVVLNANAISIYINDFTATLSNDLRTRVMNKLSFDTSTHNRSFWTKQWNSLTHHVRAHQCTVSVIVLKEWNK